MTTPPISVHILTGFLGAGKTSLLNALVRAPELARSAVLINEFGEVAIDHDLIAEVEEGAIVTTTGCLCCTAESDVTAALATLDARFVAGGGGKTHTLSAAGGGGGFNRVIVETTGLADPAPVVNALLTMKPEPARPRYQLASVITLFDIVNGDATLDEHLEAVKQVALADIVMLTKTDLARDPATRRDIETSANPRHQPIRHDP
jgi:G3E family GTPase